MSLSKASRYFRTTSFRLNLWYGGLFSLSAIALFIVLYFLLSYLIAARDRESLKAQVQDYAQVYYDGGPRKLKSWINQQQRSRKLNSFFVRITTAQGAEIFLEASDNWIQFDVVRLGPLILRSPSWLRIPEDDERDLIFHRTLLADGSTMVVGKVTNSRDHLLEPFRQVFIASLIPIILLGFIGGSIFTHRTLSSIRQIISTVQSIIKTRNLDARVPISNTADELDELAHLFNQMLDQNQSLIRNMRESLDNVAHDLRTPLTGLRGTAEMALQSQPGKSAQSEALADCLEESDRLLTLINTLMSLAEAEAGMMHLDIKPTNLSQILDNTTEMYGYVADEQGIRINRDYPNPIEANIDGQRMRQVIANLLDNAVKYNTPNGSIDVSASKKGEAIIVKIHDTGQGITEVDQSRIWERLFRADRSRSQRGLGLGLSLVKAIVEAHNGTITLHSVPDQGSTFRITIPAVSETPTTATNDALKVRERKLAPITPALARKTGSHS
ncbi:MAG: Sensor histidine kinase ResE [Verrucomicrobia subdivision 3 bacterium]|nr:Sensor histidine kinase ResE [Limisphaerales bacterium]MCS1415748.1 Sensor histidine kinase ResE [Limisphaerales bacterium]